MSRKDFASDRPPDALQKQLVKGLGLAAVPIIYGVVCLVRGSTWLYLYNRGHHDDLIEFRGEEGVWLAVAFIALGVAVHFHYFWGYGRGFERFSAFGRTLALVVCVVSFAYAVYLIFAATL